MGSPVDAPLAETYRSPPRLPLRRFGRTSTPTDSEGAPREPYGKHTPAVRKKMLPFVLVAWPTVRGYCPKVFRHYQIGILAL